MDAVEAWEANLKILSQHGEAYKMHDQSMFVAVEPTTGDVAWVCTDAYRCAGDHAPEVETASSPKYTLFRSDNRQCQL